MNKTNKNMSMNSFVLLRALFNENLHDAILSKDKIKTTEIIEGYIPKNENIIDLNSKLDFDYVVDEHQRQLKEDNFKWAY